MSALFSESLTSASAQSIQTSFIYSLLIAGLMLLLYVICNIFIKLKAKPEKVGIVRARIIYLLLFVYFIIIIRIWNGSFAHFLTMLSLIAAGLVVSNKESIMNLVGFLIIHWRSVFTKGDYIQIQNYSGRVKSVGPIYIKLQEAYLDSENHFTGRVVNVPNGLLINNSVINFSDGDLFIRYTMEFPWPIHEMTEALVPDLYEKLNELINEINKSDSRYAKITSTGRADQLIKPVIIELFAKDNQDVVFFRINFISKPRNKFMTQNRIMQLLVNYRREGNGEAATVDMVDG